MTDIESDVERILADFAEQLEGIDIDAHAFVERDRSTRVPKARAAQDGFRERIFDNAPKSDGERIIAERRSW